MRASILTALIFPLLSLPHLLGAADKAKLREHYQRGYAYFQQGRLEEAEREFLKLLSLNPSIYEANSILGVIYDQMGRHSEANKYHLRAVKLKPDSSSAYNNLGLNYIFLGLRESAIKALNQALKLDDRNADAHSNLGRLYLEAGRYQDAVEHLERASDLVAGDVRTLFDLSRAYLKAGSIEKALNAIYKLRATAPLANSTLHHELGRLLAEHRIYNEAIKEYEAAVEADPGSFALNYELAFLHFRLGNFQAAKEVLERIKAAGEGSARYHNLLGSTLAMLGSPEQGVKELRKAIALDPEDPENYYNLAVIFLEVYRDRDQEAVKIMEEAVRRMPDSAKAHFGLGVILHSLGVHAQAQQALRRAVQLRPDWAEAHSLLGDSYQASGDLDKAIDAYAKAAEMEPDSFATLTQHASALFKKGDAEGAIKMLKRALELNPDYAEARYVLGKIYNSQERYQDAILQLERSVSIDPDHADAHYQLAQAYSGSGEREKAERELKIFSEIKRAGKQKIRRVY